MSGPGSDLSVAAGPGAPSGLVVPADELDERFSRSSGPGGQSVNTTDSRVELRWDPATSAALGALSDAARARLLAAAAARPDDFVVVASEHRSQHRNRTAARERLAERIRAALAPPPPPRRPTRPTAGSRRRRLEGKRQRSEVKRLRGRVQGDG